MHSPSLQLLLVLLGPFLSTAETLGEIKVDFDKDLEGRVGLREVPEEVVDTLHIHPNHGRKGKPTVVDAAAVDQRDLLMLSAHDLEKRQSCQPGWGWCSSGGCAPLDSTCCTGGYCDGNEDCCEDGCIPQGNICCADGDYCYPGNECIRWPGITDILCCTDRYCTAHVDEYGSTTTASTRTTTHTYTYTSTQYYYWTVTWWYYYYYWTYSVQIDASIVTSSRSTTSSILSVRTTDSSAAYEYFSSLSADLTLPTPASATSLESIAGETSFVGETSATEDTEHLPTASASSSNDSGDDRGNGNGPPGQGDNAARALMSSLDGFTAAFLTFGVGVGVMAVML